MQKLISLQQRIAPELITVIERRYAILRNLYFLQPLGRRGLAQNLRLPERSIRNEVEFLRAQGLLRTSGQGMSLTEEGESLLAELEEYLRELRGLAVREAELAKLLGLEKVIIVPGDSDRDESVKKEIGRAAANYLQEHLKNARICAVTGGTTMSDVAAAFANFSFRAPGVTIVPARGGLGEEVEKQANTVAAQMAKAVGGAYRLLHVPDDLGEEAINSVCLDPKIKELLALIKAADLVVHGIGTAEEMARRRGFTSRQIALLRERGAVGEAFGYYFAQDGRIVYTTTSVGLRLEDLAQIKKVIAVGGGRSKAVATLAVMSNQYQDVLITDEGSALEMLNLRGRGEAGSG